MVPVTPRLWGLSRVPGHGAGAGKLGFTGFTVLFVDHIVVCSELEGGCVCVRQ